MADQINTCKGTTQSGEPCKRRVADGVKYCPHHEPDREKELHQRKRLFIEFYLANGFDRTRAAIQAGYSKKSAQSKACNLMREPEIKAEIEERLSTYGMSANETVARLSADGRATMDHFVDESGMLDLESERAQNHRYLIKEIKTDQWGKPVAVKLRDPQSALKTLAKIHGIVTNRVEHTGSVEHRQAPEYDLSVLTDEELDQLERITAKLEAAKEESDDPELTGNKE